MGHRLVISSGLAIALVVIAAMTASASQLIESTLETTLLPGPVEFNVLPPDPAVETLRKQLAPLKMHVE